MKRDHDADDADDTKRSDCDCVNIAGDDSGMHCDCEIDQADDDARSDGFTDCKWESDDCYDGKVLLKELNKIYPQLQLDYDSVKGDCLKIYEEEKAKVKHFLRHMVGQISLSADILFHETTKGECCFFMSLAANFIDDGWNLKKWVLSFRRIFDGDCGCLDTAILKSLKDWELEDKISSLTLLDSNAYDEVIEVVKAKVQEKKRLQLSGQLFRVNCCAEMLSLMVQDAFKDISKIIDKVQELCWTKSSPLWYLTASKLRNALELDSMGEFSRVCMDDLPSTDEWRKVESVCKLVESTHNVAKMMFETKDPTANIYLHNLQELRTILTQDSISSDSFSSKVAKKMLDRLDEYINDMFLVLAIASVMDPCFKLQYIECYSSNFAESDGNSKVTLVLEAIRNLYDDYVKQDVESLSDSTSSSSKSEFPGSVDGASGGPTWLKDHSQFVESINQPPKSQLDCYLEEPVVPLSQDFNALKWWKAKNPKYPILSKMAREILAIPVSIATSYDAYYTEYREADLPVFGTEPDLRNAVVCTRNWLRGRSPHLSPI
ncbi:zinc finger BED domain-containing protein RICESLEEPER 1-like [Cornus florida]|uniref:zinc finger BED domain-containing protein RICESLEEPER 1-like n=1 Tax=Cornus florida TaxID=4283 RepID=UPI002898EB9E|nr:zinc finger BED domain-containing protein RICESLEEPER 1-like [Cornus florida]XP_059631997.1 zinc finger BED domain-containing protein RICESLEEPER 1-like [Cornus florida]XP_059631998.1 zinc finger BED domain-containing protein RICESLEEPER 1-like [Cornus florida]